MNRKSTVESDPRHHVAKIRDMMTGVIEHMREDIAKVDDPRARALLETSAEVMAGLVKAFRHYETGSEEAWKLNRPLSQS